MRGNEITVKVNKETLLTRLKENREKHGQAYATALDGWKIIVRRQLEKHIAALDEGEVFDRFYTPAPPEDHTEDYDAIIDMMTMSLGSEVELTQSQFREYVRDDWGWKDLWVTSNTEYTQASLASR